MVICQTHRLWSEPFSNDSFLISPDMLYVDLTQTFTILELRKSNAHGSQWLSARINPMEILRLPARERKELPFSSVWINLCRDHRVWCLPIHEGDDDAGREIVKYPLRLRLTPNEESRKKMREEQESASGS